MVKYHIHKNGILASLYEMEQTGACVDHACPFLKCPAFNCNVERCEWELFQMDNFLVKFDDENTYYYKGKWMTKNFVIDLLGVRMMDLAMSELIK